MTHRLRRCPAGVMILVHDLHGLVIVRRALHLVTLLAHDAICVPMSVHRGVLCVLTLMGWQPKG